MNPKRVGWFSAGEMKCDPVPPLSESALRLVLLGPPGVGKGTQAQMLCERLRICHLATGDLFRAAQCEGATSPAMQQALQVMQRGELISDDLVIAMVRERCGCLLCQGGFLLDGFPRTLRQAEALEEMLADCDVQLDATIYFDMPIEAIVARLSGRRICSKCAAVFHVTANPPARPDVCDHCQGSLVQRDDDRPDAIRVRMRVYTQETRPLITFYEQRGKLQRIRAVGDPEQVFARTMKRLDQRIGTVAG